MHLNLRTLPNYISLFGRTSHSHTPQARVISGPTAAGWTFIQFSLVNATAFTHDLDLPSQWNVISLTDVSGQGFGLTLSRIRVLPLPAPPTRPTPSPPPSGSGSGPGDSGGEIAAIASAPDNGELGDSGSIDVIPVFNIESVDQAADGDVNRFILRLRPGVTQAQLLEICAEADASSPAFRAVCPAPDPEQAASVQSLDQEVTWPFQPVRLENPDTDLNAMRLTLGNVVQYIERDLQASLFRPDPVTSDSDADSFESAESGSAARRGLTVDANGRPFSEGKPQYDPVTGEPIYYIQDASPSPTPAPAPAADDGVLSLNSVESPQLMAETLAASAPTTVWSLDRIDQLSLPLDGRYGSGPVDGAGIHAFILDTGLRATHVEFQGRVGDSKNTVDGSTDTTDRNGHGSHVAGTVLGASLGVARQAIVHSVKVMGDNGAGAYSNIIAGLQWVKSYVAQKGLTGRAVVNLSIGGPRSQTLNDAVTELITAGIPVVVAAGNSHADACSFSPSSATGAMAVGATTAQDTMSSFSNFGTCLGIFAPGSSILSVGYTCDTCTATMSDK